jgi:hypothetical protein
LGVREIEHLLCEHGGFSTRQAKKMASAAWRAINNSNDDVEAEAILRASLSRLATRQGAKA